MCKSLGTDLKTFPVEFISQYVKYNKFYGFTLKGFSLCSLDHEQNCRLVLQRDTTTITVLLASVKKVAIDLFNYDQVLSDEKASTQKIKCGETDLQFSNGHYRFVAEFLDRSTMSFVCRVISAIIEEV